jgi:hypothetical protein
VTRLTPGKPPGATVRLDLESRDGKREVIAVEPDEVFWPTQELVFSEGDWTRR